MDLSPTINSKLSQSGNPDYDSAELFENGQPEEESILEETRKGLPYWLISIIIHIVLILVLVLIPFRNEIGRGVSLFGTVGEGVGEGDAAFEIVSEGNADTEETNDSLESIHIASSTASMQQSFELPQPKIPTLDGIQPSFDQAISMGLSGRTGSKKQSLLRAYGGTAGTQDAVELGLKWLAKQQQPDGSWSLRGKYSNGAVNENKAAATAMALLAFLGAGNTHISGEYKKQVNKGLYYLLQIQNKDGFFARDALTHQKSYTQAQCTIVICELYAMSKDKSLLDHATSAIRYAEYSQGVAGGWRYEPKTESDVSVTGWFVMALMSARMGSLEVDASKLAKVNEFLDTVQHDRGSAYSYLAFREPSYAMTAEGLLCRLYLGWQAYDPRVQDGAKYLLERTIKKDGLREYYYWYYATQTFHHIGGKFWDQWNADMRVNLPALQETSGNEIGSWDPGNDQWGPSGGRLYSTCFAIYCLEVYYRHLPLYGNK